MKQWRGWIGVVALLVLCVCAVACNDLSKWKQAVDVAVEKKAKVDAGVEATSQAARDAEAAALAATERADALRVIADREKSAEAEAAALAATNEAAQKAVEAEALAIVAAKVSEEYARISPALDAGITAAKAALEQATEKNANSATMIEAFIKGIAPLFGGTTGLALTAGSSAVGLMGLLFGKKKSGEAQTAAEQAEEQRAIAAKAGDTVLAIVEAFDKAKKIKPELSAALKAAKAILLETMTDDAVAVIETRKFDDGTAVPTTK